MIGSGDTPFVAAMLLLGAILGGAILLLIRGLTPVEEHEPSQTSIVDDMRRGVARVGRRIPLAVGVGLLLLVVTGWPVLAISGALLVFFWGALFGGAAAERAGFARLEGLASWTESLRDTIAGAVGLEQAIPATAAAASPAIAKAVTDLSDRLRVRMPLPTALLRLAEELDDPAADLVVAALLLNSKLRGPGLRDVLTSLAGSVRSELEMRGRIMAGRRSTRRSVQIVVAVSAAFILGLKIFNPDYVAPYGTPIGQIVLFFIAAIFAAGFFWLRRLAAFEMPQRFLDVEESGRRESRSDQSSARSGGGGRR